MQLQLTSLEFTSLVCRFLITEQEAQERNLPRHVDGYVTVPLFEDEFQLRGFAWQPEVCAWTQAGESTLLRLAATEIAYAHEISVV